MFQPKYTITDKIVQNIAKISEIRNLIDSAKILPEREAFIRKVANAKIAHFSTSIEGNSLLPHEVNAIQAGKRINANEKEVTEVKNYLKALKLIDQLSENKKEISISDILDIHKCVMNNLIEEKKVGKLRQTPVYIVNISNGIEEVMYTPPNAKMVEKYLKDLIKYIQSEEIHPIIKAGIFHYQFESIHPFVDGNGRTGRLLSLLYLYLSGFKFKKILVLEDYYSDNRKKYYESLQIAPTYDERVNKDLTKWLDYYIEGFLLEVSRVKDQVLSLKGISNKNRVIQYLDKDQIKIIDFIITLGKITSDDVVDILSVPKRTAQNKLKSMVDKKIIKKKGLGPTTFYIAS